MALDNFRDLSNLGSDIHAGFQFEFQCGNCPRTWKSPFKPYRMGQFTGLLMRVSRIVRGAGLAGRASYGISNAGVRGAHEEALREAQQRAQTLFTSCAACGKAVCADCFNTREGVCQPCLGTARQQSTAAAEPCGAALRCPNCNADHGGGRFCAECGFDMASTHKSCPGCGALCLRQARFCPDCGHGF